MKKSWIVFLLLSMIYVDGRYTRSQRITQQQQVPVRTITSVSPDKSIRIATYNIRRAGPEQSKANMWATRKRLVLNMISKIKPDIIGFQEAIKNQLDDLSSSLVEYDFFGQPRGAKMTGLWQKFTMKFATNEYNPIFFKKNKFTLLSQGDFGINPTGRGRLFTANLPRICTWGHFQDKETQQKFYVYNTHLDNKSGIIRRRQISQIMKHVMKNTNHEPVIFMGDLNTPLNGKKKLKRLSRAGFVHAKTIAHKIVGPQETRTGWANGQLKMIDHILIKSPGAQVLQYQVVASPVNVFPSDHRPVFIDIVL